MDRVTLTRSDLSEQTTTTGFHTSPLTAVNFDAQNTLLDDLVTAVNAVTLSTSHNVLYQHRSVQTQPDKTGRRELKWLVHYTADSAPFQSGTVEIGNADESLATVTTPSGGKLMNTSDAEYISLKAKIEDIALTSAGQTFTVGDIELVGRNI